ncbi:MAG TPA: AbrB/MazE/SpoVT family DNA-binding domain-containing protein [Candidatus Moranbacteria bacterium]|nr:AbrB/MazE/SpoVT family DNA-binding domain-containing protein [Candidatus Moranbacteria bacterium]HSA08481.1 AbrB/MazE/SpoVT family DNA-binding domain-containing protein [Candidatus Moranbacteria bacterium]
MPRRKNEESNVRKLVKLGGQSLAVTLPIEIMRELGWKEKQKVVVKMERKKIIIADWKK